MSGYTALTEKLDPEEVKEIMSEIFGEISKVVSKYAGFIEKFVGDAIMALFGVPIAHEDDPVRAIKAAKEIHDIVASISSKYEKKIGMRFAMHTGICTGLVVTGDVNQEKGTHGVLGDTINTAYRLSGLAKLGEIVVGPDTYRQAEGYFSFEALEVTSVKGKVEAVRPYKVVSPKKEPAKIHRVSGMRAKLIGREVEMDQLKKAMEHLKQGEGSIFSIVGDAGTGKSRLIEEFKATLDLEEVQWREGHAYAYSQNIPYFPVIDLLSRAWQIYDGDRPEQIKQKVEIGARLRIGDREDLIPYVGSLYSLSYPEIDQVSPESWKARLHEAIKLILANLCQRGPTVVCLEDLHWADPSSVELLRNILSDFRHPVLFLCIYRPMFGLFTDNQVSNMKPCQEISLQDLSPTDSQSMLESLLKTRAVPGELKKFIQDKAEGNPFYLEEVINSLIETATLIDEGGQWTLTRPMSEANVPSTVQGVVTARLDRLEKEMKRLLQEASVIGRAFLYEILKRVTEIEERIDARLIGLEKLDLIRTRTSQPDLEYIFKHALTQEVVYNGLLKKDRRKIHEKIGQVTEVLFQDRLPEFYEALAYHFKQGRSVLKAVDYLMKAGQKSLNRYALDESHLYYSEAYELIINKPDHSNHDKLLLMDLLLNWAVVYHYRGAFKELENLLKGHEELAISLNDAHKLGMFYVRLGGAMEYRDKLKEAYQYLRKALQLGEQSGDQKVIGYACAYLAFTCADRGLLDEAVAFGRRVQEMDIYMSDPELHRLSNIALGMAYFARGEARKAKDLGKAFIDYGQRRSNVACVAHGYLVLVWGLIAAGDFHAAVECGNKAISEIAFEPLSYVSTKVMLGYAHVANGQYREAEDVCQEIMKFNERYGYEKIGTVAHGFHSIVLISKGDIRKGIKMIEALMQTCLENDSQYRYVQCHYQLGQVYMKMVRGGGKTNWLIMLKNFWYLIRTIPFAARRAESHLNKAAEVARAIGAKGVLGQAYLDLGKLRKRLGKPDEAKKFITDAISLFETCGADSFLRQAREFLGFP